MTSQLIVDRGLLAGHRETVWIVSNASHRSDDGSAA
jgi:hypothetical protein